jgi:tetratricopeptide (TPR) repeat protein
LGSLYFQRIRETADVSDYEKIAVLMQKSEIIDPKNSDILSLQSQIAIGRHDFGSGKILIEKAIKLNPNRAAYYGILGDSQIELGEYTGAVDSFQKMIDMRPDYNSYIRIGYIRELY